MRWLGDIIDIQLLCFLRQLILGCKLAHVRASAEVELGLADSLAGFDPSVAVCLLMLLRQFGQRRPVGSVVVFKLDVAAGWLQQLCRRNVLAQVFVEL